MASTIEPVRVYDANYKLLLIGDGRVGKTSIIYRYVDNVFTTSLVHTIGIDLQMKTIEVEGQKIKLQIWDTAGQEFHSTRSITKNFYRGASGVLFVYDVTNQLSYDHVRNWSEAIRTFTEGTDVKRMLIGNKCDCETTRVVSLEDGRRLAENMGVPFIETSAKTGANVSESFETIARMIVNGQPQKRISTFDTEQPTLSPNRDDGRTCRC